MIPELSKRIHNFRGSKEQNTYWLPVVAYSNVVRIHDSFLRWHDEKIIIPFVASTIFLDKESALHYFKYFLNELINENSIPKESIIDGKIDENLIKLYVKKVEVGYVEEIKEEKEGRLDDWVKEEN